MKFLVLFLSLLLSFNVSQARWSCPYDLSELTDEALILQVEAIGDEIEAHNHDQEIMNMAFNRSRVIRKRLNRLASKVSRMDEATDSDIMPLLQDIVLSLDTLTHTTRNLAKVKRHLDKILLKLEENREAPTEIAILNFTNITAFDFGTIVAGGTRTINFTISNDGNGDAEVLDEVGLVDPFYFAGKIGYPGQSGTCGVIIPAGTSCVISIEYNPIAAGSSFSESVILEYNDGVEVQTVSKDVLGSTY